uniref:Uncharacterized protein n=1 Tax=Engystomops pustulosus TaxID=76066 RepID=A0AAV6YLZ2_ENGPU|nr:hypothetical protein GDO81_022651 [Engystomops pustulosus]
MALRALSMGTQRGLQVSSYRPKQPRTCCVQSYFKVTGLQICISIVAPAPALTILLVYGHWREATMIIQISSSFCIIGVLRGLI